MLDSDHEKVKDYPLNSIVIPPYTESEVIHPQQDQNEILMTVKDYLFKMFEEEDDV